MSIFGYCKKIGELGGRIVSKDGERFVYFDGPPEVPENALSIHVKDFGYSKANGIFRKSIRPKYKSEVNL